MFAKSNIGNRQKNFYVTRIFHSAYRMTNPFFIMYTIPKTIFPQTDIPKIRMIARTLLRLTRNKKLIFDSEEKKNKGR